MGSGNCVFWAPETFDLSDDGHAVVLDAARHRRGPAARRGAGLPRRRHLPLARRRRGPAGGEHVMPIAVTEDHESLRATALRWAQTHCPASVPRQAAEAPPGAAAELPAAWEKMAAQGWLGLHLSEEQGGQGFTPGRAGHRARGARSRPLPRAGAAHGAGLRRPGPRAAGPGGRAAGVAARAGRRLHHGRSGAGCGAPALAAGGRTERWHSTGRCARCSGCPRPAWS